ncbi:MAG: type II toxin-antitoxin system HicA family toxin [Planctomycetota bacterium]
MTRSDELLDRILDGRGDANIPFLGLRSLLLRLGFVERIRGSHHVFQRPGVPGKLNIQRKGHEAKPYQVRQVRRHFLRQGIGREE